MKRAISMLLVIIMIISGITALADDRTSKAMENALIIVKSKITIPAELSEFSPYTYEENGKTVYNFTWQKEDGGGYIEVSCDEKGRILNYYSFDNSLRSEKKMTVLTKEDILKFADDFMRNALPEAFADENDSLLYDDKSWNVNNLAYNITYKRYKNGVEVKDNYATIRVNVNDDIPYVRNMNVSFNYDADFEEVTTEFADYTNKYMETYPLELIYRDKYSYYTDKEQDKTETDLVYRNLDGQAGYISAVTGEVVEEDVFNNLYLGGAGGAVEDAVTSNKNMLTEKELAELDKIEGIISKDDAGKIIKKLPYVDFDKNLIINNYNINKNDEMYNVNISYKTKDDKRYLSVNFNGETGEVLSLNNNEYYTSDNDVELTDSQKNTGAKRINEFSNAVSLKFSQFKETNENISGYTIQKIYNRYVNDVRYIGNSINVKYDAKLGRITQYSINYNDDKVFDDKSDVVSNYMAYKCLLGIAPLQKIYIISGGKYTLCWTLSEYGVQIDAFTGNRYKEVNYSENKPFAYTDISGHWAEEKIKKLAEMNIGFEGDKFYPDAAITQYDLLRLFAAGVLYQSYLTYPADSLYENFIFDGILTESEKNPEGQVLREDAFVYIIRLDGLEKVAKLSNIFKVEYADGNLLSKGKIGYPAILTGMNVICGNGGYLKPLDAITRAEAVTMVYNYMMNAN